MTFFYFKGKKIPLALIILTFVGLFFILGFIIITFINSLTTPNYPITLSGSVLESTSEGKLPLGGAEATVIINDNSYKSITDSLGNFTLTIPSFDEGTTDIRVIVSYPNFEVLGRDVQIVIPKDTQKNGLEFSLGELDPDERIQKDLTERGAEILALYREEINNYQSDTLRLSADSAQLDVSGRLLLERLRGDLRKLTYQLQFLEDDSAHFSDNLLSAQKFLKSIEDKEQKYYQIVNE